MEIDELWRAGELARESGVSTDTLRHYERKKVLPAPLRSANGYRMYPAAALDRVRLIRRALAVGFSLDELGLILKERDSGGSPCREVHRLAAEKLANIEERLKALIELRDDLRRTLADWEKRLELSDGDSPSRLLESLSDKRSPGGIRRLSPRSKRKKEGYK
jgi:DNA-binding transcriptional MerR regulator